MLVIAAEISVKPDQLDAFKELIAWQAESSVAEEPGCHQFDVCQAELPPSLAVGGKPPRLFAGVREFPIAVRQFHAAPEHLEAFRHRLIRRIDAGECCLAVGIVTQHGQHIGR